MTDSIFDQIKADRKAGTVDFRWQGERFVATEFGETVELFSADWSALDEYEHEHKCRLERVDKLERIALVAEELSRLVDLVNGSFGGGRVITFSDSDVEEFGAALAEFQEACK